MSLTRILATLLFVAILAGTFALSQPGDVEILRRVGHQSLATVRSGLPESDKLGGPLAAFRAGDALPIEELVRVRIQNDQDLNGAAVVVVATPTAGQVKLKGEVQNGSQKSRALELAGRTSGVVSVIDEMAMPVNP